MVPLLTRLFPGGLAAVPFQVLEAGQHGFQVGRDGLAGSREVKMDDTESDQRESAGGMHYRDGVQRGYGQGLYPAACRVAVEQVEQARDQRGRDEEDLQAEIGQLLQR